MYILSKQIEKTKQFDLNIITGDNIILKKKIEYYNNVKLFICLPLKNKITNIFRCYINLITCLKKINFDIVIIRGAGFPSSVVALIIALYCKIFKKRYIYSIAHECEVNGELDHGLMGKLFKFFLYNANYIVAQNYDQIIKLKKWTSKVIQNKIKMFKSGYEIEKKDQIIKDIILWVGRAVKWKRPEKFINLSMNFPNHKFVMICRKDNDLEYWNFIINKINDLPNFEFIPYVPFNLIESYFKRAKIFINTSIYEGFPNTFVQSCKNKTPIISLNVSPDGILEKNKIGFFCEDSFSKLQNNLKFLLNNNQEYQEYSNNCYDYVMKEHNIEKISKRWITLF